MDGFPMRMNPPFKTRSNRPDADGHFKVYSEYATVLRAWFVAYGIGGPVLLLTQSKIAQAVRDSGHAKSIVLLFLVGVGLQIFIAVVNKWVNWYLYAYADPLKELRIKNEWPDTLGSKC